MIEIPSVSQASIELGICYASPESRSKMRQIHLATTVGVNLDDCIDFVHRASNVSDIRKHKLFDRYTNSFNQYIEKYPKDKNIYWLCTGIVKTESLALDNKNSDWNPEMSKKYRESVNAVWAIYLGSLVNTIELNLDTVIPLDQTEIDTKIISFIKNNPFCKQANLYTRQLFFGSMLFQTISDWEKKDFAIENGIPSFGGVGFEHLSEYEAKKVVDKFTEHYLNEASRCSMNKSTLLKMVSILRFFKRVPKPLLKNSAIKDWHYS